MCQLVETIRIDPEGIQNLHFHQLRMNKSRKTLFGETKDIKLDQIISIKFCKNGILKCRVIYAKEVKRIEYLNYVRKPIATLKTIYDPGINYSHKFENREDINKIFEQRGECDDVLIISEDHITDSSYANILLRDRHSGKWFTPDNPLLSGTKRQELITTGKVQLKKIRIQDLKAYDRFKLINAMFGEDSEEHPIENIKL